MFYPLSPFSSHSLHLCIQAEVKGAETGAEDQEDGQ